MERIYDSQTLAQYRVNRPGQAEVIRMSLYDYQLYGQAGNTQMTFFALPIGQGVTSAPGATVGGPKTYADTNMLGAGQLPRPISQLVESIEVVFQPGASSAANTYTPANPSQFAAAAAAAVIAQVADVNSFRTGGWLEFFIGNKTYLWELLNRFPTKTYLELDAALSTDSATLGEIAAVNARWGGRPYYLEPPITLETLQNFAVYLKWPGVITTPSGFNGRVGVILDGVQYRLSQ